MGLFSNEYVTTVGTVVSRVIKDDGLPNSMKTEVLRALIKNEDLPTHIINGMVNNLSVHADRMYEYAEGNYTFGLPSGEFVSEQDAAAEVLAILNSMYGSVLLKYSHFGPKNLKHFAWQHIIDHQGYDTTNNRLNSLSNSLNRDVYLNGLFVNLTEADASTYPVGSLKTWGISSVAGYTPYSPANALLGDNPVNVTSQIGSNIAVSYVYTEPTPGYDSYGEYVNGPHRVDGMLHIPLYPYSPGPDVFHVEFYAGGVRRYWDYAVGSGWYGDLDAYGQYTPPENGTFFPFLYFRYGKVNQASNTSSSEYITSKKMAKYLGIDYASVCASIDENPDIADVEQAMMIMAIPANSSNQADLRYLYDFFSTMYYSGDNPFSGYLPMDDYTVIGTPGIVNTNGITIKDARFKMVVGNNGVITNRVAGVIGALDSYSMWEDSITVQQDYWQVMGDGDPIISVRDVLLKVHVYAHQVNLYEYDEVRVVNLKTLFYVLEAYASTADENNDILFIPLDRSITRGYSLPYREELYARSLHFVFNSVIITKLKWYQSEWFQFVLILVAVVVTVVTLGSDGGAFANLVVAITAGSEALITAAVLVLLEKILIGLVISYVLKLVVKELGVAFAIIAAVVLLMLGVYDAVSSGSLAGAPWAQELLYLSNGLAKAAQQELQEMMNGLFNEMKAFDLLMDVKVKELEEAQKLLENHSWLSPTIFFGETPEDFFNRTVHSGNIGVITIGAISSYVDIALTLPKLDEQVGGFNDD